MAGNQGLLTADPPGKCSSSKSTRCTHAVKWSLPQHRFCQRVGLLRIGVVAARWPAGNAVAAALCQPLACTCTPGAGRRELVMEYGVC
jgi:hypothetical protein